MKVNCLSCGHTIDLDDSSYSDYEGLVKCYACNALLEVKLVDCGVKAVRFPERPARPAAPAPDTGPARRGEAE